MEQNHSLLKLHTTKKEGLGSSQSHFTPSILLKVYFSKKKRDFDIARVIVAMVFALSDFVGVLVVVVGAVVVIIIGRIIYIQGQKVKASHTDRRADATDGQTHPLSRVVTTKYVY